MDPARPVAAAEFASLMQPFAPFEAGARLALGVSGGADSMALALLARDWAAARGGSVLALVVDHRLRSGSGAEALRTRERLAADGIETRGLRRAGPRPEGNIQARARAARHALLQGACRSAGILHLLLAHHLDDQAETLLLRLTRGSGLDGLAAMAGESAGPAARVLRPVIGLPAARLRATLVAHGTAWFDDPTNDDPAFARVRLRRAAPMLAREGLSAARAAATARHLGRARQVLEAELARLLVRAVRLDPAGFATLDAHALAAAPAELRLRALARILATIGGRDYAPRFEALERLAARLGAGAAGGWASTLAGCRIACRGENWQVYRETAAADRSLAVDGPGWRAWDGRWRIHVPRGLFRPGIALARLGRGGWRRAQALADGNAMPSLPAPARASLPALWRGAALIAVPMIGAYAGAGTYAGSGAGAGAGDSAPARAVFCPRRALAGPGFAPERQGFTLV